MTNSVIQNWPIWSIGLLRIPDSYDAKIAKICNFWTFWPVIQLINHLFKCYFKNVTALFTSMEHWAKGLFVWFWIEGLLAELQVRMSRDCRFLLFWHHNYQVSLTRGDRNKTTQSELIWIKVTEYVETGDRDIKKMVQRKLLKTLIYFLECRI